MELLYVNGSGATFSKVSDRRKWLAGSNKYMAGLTMPSTISHSTILHVTLANDEIFIYANSLYQVLLKSD